MGAFKKLWSFPENLEGHTNIQDCKFGQQKTRNGPKSLPMADSEAVYKQEVLAETEL